MLPVLGRAGLCRPSNWVRGDGLVAVPEEAAPCAAALVAATAQFLGPYMIKDFDLIQFLEDASAAPVSCCCWLTGWLLNAMPWPWC